MSNAPQAPQYPVIYTAPTDSKLKNLAMMTGAESGILLFISFIINAAVDYNTAAYDILSPLAYIAVSVGAALMAASLLIWAGAVAMKGSAR